MFSIRPFEPDTDYPGIAAVWNAAWPVIPRPVRQWRQEDLQRPTALHFERLVVEMADEIVGFGELMQNVEPETPFWYWATLEILPAYQRMNICSALYTRLLRALQHLNAQRVFMRVRADQPARIQFLEARGFQQKQEVASIIGANPEWNVWPEQDTHALKWLRFEKECLVVN